MFEIEKGIPIPNKMHLRKTKYPLAQMEIGDSFAIPVKEGEVASVVRNRFKTSVNRREKDFNQKFATRCDGNTVRVWRIK